MNSKLTIGKLSNLKNYILIGLKFMKNMFLGFCKGAFLTKCLFIYITKGTYYLFIFIITLFYSKEIRRLTIIKYEAIRHQ